MKIKLVLLLLVTMTHNALSQQYFINFSTGNSFNFDNLNSKAKNIFFSDDSNLRIATNKNRLDFLFFLPPDFGLSFNKTLNKRAFIECKFLTDVSFFNLYFNYATAEPNTANFVNVSSRTIKFGYDIYNFSLKYNFLLNQKKQEEKYQGIKTKMYFFTSFDILTPTFNATLNKSGSVYGNDGVSYNSANGLKEIEVIVNVKNRNIISFRPCVGLTLKVFKKNKALFNLQTFWAFNSLKNLAYGFVNVYEDKVLVSELQYKLTTAGWYFNISKDIYFKKKFNSKRS